ncbi:MAG: sulfide:quinone reductase, partial [Actinomycetota bacterium]
MTVRIVVVGGSFGGLASAYELRKHLEIDKCEITLISKDQRFTFIPSLPWLALGSKTLEQISFDLAPALASREIAFANETALAIDPESQIVTTDQKEHPYDYLMIATGHRSANEAVSGLGPFSGPGHSLMSPSEASELRGALARFLESPG